MGHLSGQRHRKAVLFTLISVLVAALFIALFAYNSEVQSGEKTLYTNTRIYVMDNYVKNFEKYAQSSIRISTYRTLESLSADLTADGRFFSDRQAFERAFSSCLRCGYLDCANMVVGTQCPAPLRNSSQSHDLNASLYRISSLARDNLNINTAYIIHSVNITQEYPFEVKVTVDMSYNISDNLPDSTTSWSLRRNITERVTIIGLSDPLFTVNSDGDYQRKVHKSSLCEFNQSCWNVSNVRLFYLSEEYRYEKNSTSYLGRFWNSTNFSSCCGIESFVNIKTLNASFMNMSYVDNSYWNRRHVCTGSLSDPTILLITQIDNSSGGFRIDSATAARYNITSAGVKACPY